MLFEDTRRTFIQCASGALGVLGGVGRRDTAATATTVSGRVFDIHGDPVPEGPVEAYAVSDAEMVAETTTDRDGRFELPVGTAGAVKLVALGSGTEPSWFDVRETAPDAAEPIEMRLQRQVLFEPTVATTRDDAQLGAVTLWRWVDAGEPSNQVLYLELTETRADGTPWELAGAPHGIRRGLVRVTVPESMTVHRGRADPNVPPGTVGAAYLQRNRHRQGVAQWHPLRAPTLPSFETADGERIGVFPRHEVETGTDDGSVDLSFSLLSLVLGGIPILGTLLDVLGLVMALSGDDGLANPDSTTLADAIPEPDFGSEDVLVKSWTARSADVAPSAAIAQLPVRWDGDGSTDDLEVTVDAKWKTTSDRTARFAKTLGLSRFDADPRRPPSRSRGTPYTLAVESTGDGEASYEFSVSGRLEAGTLVDTDPDGSTASGTVGPYTGVDDYRFSGGVVQFSLDGPANVYVDDSAIDAPGDTWGTERPHTIVIDGRNDAGPIEYAFGVDGEAERSEWRTEGGDGVRYDGTVEGSVQGDEDAYRFSGSITPDSFVLDGPADVYLDGVEVDPAERWGLKYPNTLVLDGGGRSEPRRYVIEFDGEFTTSAWLGETEYPDHINDVRERVEGEIAGGRDGYRFDGEITAFYVDGPAEVYLNGERVDPAETWTLKYPHSLVVEGKDATRARGYVIEFDGEFTTSAWLGETEYPDHINDVRERVEGEVAGGRDGYRFDGEITAFYADGPADVHLDGELVYPFEAWELKYPNALVIKGPGTDTETSYRFEYDGAVVSSDWLGPTQYPDHINEVRQEVEGTVTGGQDGYRFSGDITALDLDGSADVYLNGHPVDPADIDSTNVGSTDFDVASFDRDDDGGIGFDDLRFALQRYNQRTIAYTQFQQVLRAHDTGQSV